MFVKSTRFKLVCQLLLSLIVASLGAQEDWYCTHIAHQCCDQLTAVNKVSADQYHLTVSRAQVSTHRGRVFFEVIRWQVTSFQMIAGSSLIFSIQMNYVVFYMCSTIKISNLISNWPRKLRFSHFLQAGKTCQLLLTFFTKVTRWSRPTSNFYALIGQNLTVSSCGKFMQHLETCLLWQLKLTEFCVNLWCF